MISSRKMHSVCYPKGYCFRNNIQQGLLLFLQFVHRCCRKGQQPFLSHTMVIGFASVLIVVVATTMIAVHGEYSSFVVESGSDSVCNMMRSAVSYIYTNELTRGQITLHFAQKLADKNYELVLDSSLNAVRIQWENKEKICRLGFSGEYNGRAEGGNVFVQYEQMDNGIMNITISGGI